MILEQMRFGKPLAEFDLGRWASHLLGDYAPAFAMIAEAAGITVDAWTTQAEVAAARRDTPIVAGVLEAGTIAAQRLTMVGRSAGADVVRFIQYAYCTLDVEPAWDLRPTGWRVQVRGDAPFDVSIAFPVPLEKLGSFVPAYNANRAVNAIPYVCAASPGILSTEDLPAILPRGPRIASS
jgi:4-hydroxy-tetrahydrodipicolinate reductase